MGEGGNVDQERPTAPSNPGVGEEEVRRDGFIPPPDDEEIRQAMERFADIPITLSVQLDRKWTTIREILELKVDSVIKLNRSAGENVELLMDGIPVGNGEIVVIEDLMGLRVTDLLLPKRLRREK